MGEKFYISTAIAYTSGKPHIGNTYEIVLADSIARFKRQRGFDVYFQTGTDEHGIKIEEKARDAEVSPQEFVDGVAKQIKDIWDLMNTSYNKFVRTTDPHHEEVVQHIFKKMYDNGDIYIGTTYFAAGNGNIYRFKKDGTFIEKFDCGGQNPNSAVFFN